MTKAHFYEYTIVMITHDVRVQYSMYSTRTFSTHRILGSVFSRLWLFDTISLSLSLVPTDFCIEFTCVQWILVWVRLRPLIAAPSRQTVHNDTILYCSVQCALCRLYLKGASKERRFTNRITWRILRNCMINCK